VTRSVRFLFALAFATSGCGPANVQREPGGSGAPSATSSTGAFAQLNALSRQAGALKTPLAQYLFYRDHYEHSAGLVRGFVAQVLASTESELGAYEQALLQYPQSAPILRGTIAPLPEPLEFRAVEAADAAARLASDRRIVMINEAHHDAHTRVLTLALLPRLRAMGFTHFAAEGISEFDRELTARGYPTRDTGPYIGEPLYGEIVRTALRLGFVVVPYEADANEIERREEGQAQHLLERVFRQDSAARLFVHGGYAHVHKRGFYLATDTMAMRLRRKSGFDPLVIDQTVLRPGPADREYADYRTLVQRFGITSATLFAPRDGKEAWSLEPGVYDISVVLPPSRRVEGRPDWLDLGGERIAVAIAIDLQPTSLPCVVEARYAGESDAAIPADRLLVEHGGGQIALFLRPGDYRITASNASAHVITTQRLHVDATSAATRAPSTTR